MNKSEGAKAIAVGDTVYTGARYFLFGEPRVFSGTVLKVSPSGRIASDCPQVHSKNFTDTVYFRTPEEVLEYYRYLAENIISRLREEITWYKRFREKCVTK